MFKCALCSELDSEEWTESKDAPEWIELIPAGPDIEGLDGRHWTLKNPDEVIKQFNARKLAMVIDYEHSTELKGRKGEPAPAAGWIKELKVEENGSVWGRVEWTSKAFNSIQSNEYKYLSPVFIYDGKTLEIIKIDSVGLTNKPNLVMTALNHQNDLVSTSVDFESNEWRYVAKALSVESITSAHDVLQALNRQEIERCNKEYISAVGELVSGGYIPPCQSEFYLAACRESGYEKALTAINTIKSFEPAFGYLLKQKYGAYDKKHEANLSHTEKAVCREMGIDESEYSKFVKGE